MRILQKRRVAPVARDKRQRHTNTARNVIGCHTVAIILSRLSTILYIFCTSILFLVILFKNPLQRKLRFVLLLFCSAYSCRWKFTSAYSQVMLGNGYIRIRLALNVVYGYKFDIRKVTSSEFRGYSVGALTVGLYGVGRLMFEPKLYPIL